MTKKIKPEDLVYEKHNFNRSGTIINFASNFLAEVTNIDKMRNMIKQFDNEISELKNNYFVRLDEEIDDVIENALLVFNGQLKFVKNHIVKGKPLSSLRRPEKPGSSSSSLSIRFQLQKTIAERIKLIPRNRKETGAGLKILTLIKLLTRFPVLLAQKKAGNHSYKLKSEIRQILYLFYQDSRITNKT